MINSPRAPLLMRHAVEMPCLPSGNAPIVYDDVRMLNVLADGGDAAHAARSITARGETRPTEVGRETTDDQ